MTKNQIATLMGFLAGGVFFLLNKVTRGDVPGGFRGGVLGFLLGYGVSRGLLALVPDRYFRQPKPAKTCPSCSLSIPMEAARCDHCGADLSRQPGPDGDAQVLSFLIRRAAAPEPRDRVEAITILGNMGPKAEQAISVLNAATSDPNINVSAKAQWAVQQVQGAK